MKHENVQDAESVEVVEEVKAEEAATPKESGDPLEDAKNAEVDFQIRGKHFLVDLEIAQEKHKIGIVPIITENGPNFRLNNLIDKENESNKTA